MPHANSDAQLPLRDVGVDSSGTGGAASQLFPQSAGFASNVSQLRISEIFFSLQGETSRIGLPTVFIRLTGCPLRCTYCDTTYSFPGMPKAAEVLFNIAGCLQEVKQDAAAQKTLKQLVAKYPDSEAAGKAKKLITTPK